MANVIKKNYTVSHLILSFKIFHLLESMASFLFE